MQNHLLRRAMKKIHPIILPIYGRAVVGPTASRPRPVDTGIQSQEPADAGYGYEKKHKIGAASSDITWCLMKKSSCDLAMPISGKSPDITYLST